VSEWRADARFAMRLTFGVLGVIAVVTSAIVVGDWPFLERAIALEDAPIAWLQSTLLAASAVACLQHSVVTTARRSRWCLVAAALFALALDERFMGHERLKEWIWLELFDADSLRAGRWPDLPILLYAIGGVASVTWIVREIRDRYSRCLLWAAIGCGTVALIIDVSSQTIALQIVEELLEVLAESLFLIGLLLAPVTTGQDARPST
jgi:hypothetical protein